MTVTAIPRVPTRHQVRDLLEGQILTGRRPPGSRLRQHELAEAFGVAVPALREALVELQSRGLVEIVDNRGAFVARLTREKLLETFDIREAIEGIAARRCCERMNRLQVRELVQLSERIHELSLRGDGAEAARLDRELHDNLLAYSGNSLVTQLARQYRWVSKAVWSFKDPEQTRGGHLALLKAIEENRPDDAERLAREAVRVARDSSADQLARDPSGLHWIDEQPPGNAENGGPSLSEEEER